MSTNLVVDRCDFNPGDNVQNRYTVKKPLGEGSFGIVYLITDSSERKYALKLLRLWEVPPEIRQPLMERFEMEFKTGQIESENLVRSIDYGTIGGNPYIVMEFCPGGDLEAHLGRCNDRAVTICQQILAGLNALHIHGKVHRDLKPENVLFKEGGIAALTDFGIAGDRTHRMTQRNIFGKPNQIFGTYAYMPPEQVNRVRGGATVLPTTDIFSFGVLAYQLLTNKLPFGTLESHNDLAMYQKRGKDYQWDRESLLAVPNGREWERVIAGCLIPDYKQRIQTARDVMQMLPQAPAGYAAPQPVQLQTYQPQPIANTHGYRLHIMQGEEYGKIYDLTQLQQQGLRLMTVGRQPGNTILVKSDIGAYVSRYHCTIEASADFHTWAIRDGQWMKDTRQWQESSNGTYVNSVRVTPQGYYLKTGDIITIGDVTLRFENY